MEFNEHTGLTSKMETDSQVQRTDQRLSEGSGRGWVKKVRGFRKETLGDRRQHGDHQREGAGGGRERWGAQWWWKETTCGREHPVYPKPMQFY